jgi:hypothetical protein
LIGRDSRGFLLVDTLIAGLIITASIAATMYLFRVGFESLGRANDANLISSKVPTMIHMAKMIDPSQGEGREDMGDGVQGRWQIMLVSHRKTQVEKDVGAADAIETDLYKVTFTLSYKGALRTYEIFTLRWKKTQGSARA